MFPPFSRGSARLRRSRAAALSESRYRVESLEPRVLLNSYVVTNVNNSGAGSLRQAIFDANANAGFDSIDFNIPGAGVQTIRPTFFLPVITGPVAIDGSTQPGFAPGQPLIEINGSLAGTCSGLEFQVGGNLVQGLVVNGFARDGIVLSEDGNPDATGDNTVKLCFIGTDPTGLIDRGNGRAGLHLIYSPNNTVSDNLISGNGDSGVFVADGFSTANHFERNLIGTDRTGLVALGNGINGIALGAPAGFGAAGYASGNFVGAPGAGLEFGNVIAGNGESGVLIERGTGNVVQGNYIGVGVDGRTAIPNGTEAFVEPNELPYGGDGVFIKEGSDNLVGGAAEGAGNVISANRGAGVRIDAFTRSASNNLVRGNLIGTDKDANLGTGLGNRRGIEIRDDNDDPVVVAFQNHIGGIDADDNEEEETDGTVHARNVISGNLFEGILLAGDGVTHTQIKGNYIGVDGDGLFTVSNGREGIFIAPFLDETVGPSDIVIGGEEPGAMNLISGNTGDGISIHDSSRIAIAANLIGTNKNGNSPIGNERGVAVFDSSMVFIGATATVEGEEGPEEISLGNLVSGNRSIGVIVGGALTNNVHVIGNYIGTDVAGNVRVGNGNAGVVVSDASNVTIGGLTTASRNVIGGNELDGVLIRTPTATNNKVIGNYIGLGADGESDVYNGSDGVHIDDAPGNTIGGVGDGVANIISANVEAGVHVTGEHATGNEILGNYIGTDSSGNGAGTEEVPLGNSEGVAIDEVSEFGVPSKTKVYGNVIGGNLNFGVRIGGGAFDNEVFNNYIGTNLEDVVLGNGGIGVFIDDAPTNTVGGDRAKGEDNLIVNNGGAGIHLQGAGAVGNKIFGNGIGLNAANGIVVLAGATGTNISGNLITANTLNGVAIENSDGTILTNNLIGTTREGTEPKPNLGFGVSVINAAGTVIGGGASFADRGNLISGNTGIGIVVTGARTLDTLISGNHIGTDITGTQPLGNEEGVTIIGLDDFGVPSKTRVRANIIGGNRSHGVRIAGGAFGNVIANNHVGTSPGGLDLGNGGNGVLVENSPRNTIGGDPAAGEDNLITRNHEAGVRVAGPESVANDVFGNGIGLNRVSGVEIVAGAAGTRISANLITSNMKAGVYIEDSDGTSLTNNLIGTTREGTEARGNDGPGVWILDSARTVIGGGSFAEQGNLISGNMTQGVVMSGDRTVDTLVVGNYIGSDVTGTQPLGNGEEGVAIGGSPELGLASKTAVRGNVILGNGKEGVLISRGAFDNVVGGVAEGAANQISGNRAAGVAIITGAGAGNAVLRNRIFDNAGLGIDLGDAGHTPNDQRTNKDADTGPNNLQNFPELATATVGASRRITGTIKSAASQLYILEFFASDDPDASGFGEGQRYVTTTAVTTNASGVASFDVILPEGETTFSFISATATDANGNTSEFSKWIRVQTDADGDGVSDGDEGGGANGGDGNADGVRDAEQPNVVSVRNPATGGFVTLEAPAGTTLRNVRALENPSPDDGPTEAFPLGFFDFSLSGLTPGASVPVKLYLPAGVEPRSYFRYGPTPDNASPHWYDWFYDGLSGAVIDRNVVTLNFTDGWRGDDDLAANGTIADAGGPGFPYRIVVTNTLDAGPGSLRQAILDANSLPGPNFIDFSIGGGGVQTIAPASALPAITGAVVIDGTTQPGFAGTPVIELSGVGFPGTGLVVHASDTIIRGLVVNRFTDWGILVTSSGSLRPNNVVVEGNFLGTDVTGMHARGNRWGVQISFGTGHRIGGATPAARNVISANTLDGVTVGRGDGIVVQGNLIGTGVDGVSPLGNGGNGVGAGFDATNLTIGGLEAGAGNTIAFNSEAGIFINTANKGYGFLSNSIHHNGLLGINLQVGTGVNLNDPGLNDGLVVQGGDPRNYQNYPVLGSAQSAGGQTTISGYLNSRPDSTFLIQFFANSAMEISGFGEGETLVGTTTVTTGADGHGEFTATFDVALPFRTLISATATDANNNTSEFSRRLAVGDVLGSVYTVNTTDDVDDGIADAAHTSLREAIHAANNHPGLDVIRFAIGSGVRTIAPLTTLPGVTDAVTIDGTTQPGFAGTPLIELIGTQIARDPFGPSNSGLYLHGLAILANDSTVRGLAINRFFEFGAQVPTHLWGGTPLAIFGDRNVVEGNVFGTDVTGTLRMANLGTVTLIGNNNRVGGTTPQARNVISGSQEFGLRVEGAATVVQGNFIGTDLTGTKAIGNGRGTAFGSLAVLVAGRDHVIGGAEPGAGNLIAGNLGDALRINSGFGTVVRGNRIGTDVTGTKLLANSGDGIIVDEFSFRQPERHVTIGGALPGEGNVVAGHRVGVFLNSSDNVVHGNRIGTDVTGTLDLGNGDGVLLRGDRNQIGGAAAGAGNLISGNNRYGVLLLQSGADNKVQGNRIGTQADGTTPLGNTSDGVVVAADFFGGTSGTGPIDNLIGGADGGAGNVIAFNGGRGVNVLAGQRIGILSNSVFSNGQLGIDLNGNGVTPNDAGDADAPTGDDNGLQNYPVLTALATDGALTTVHGTLDGIPNILFTLQFFASPAADPTGFGEGQTLLGTRVVRTDAAGNASFTLTFPVGVAVGHFVTATATDAANNSSEFSLALAVAAGEPAPNQAPVATAGGPYVIGEGGVLTLDATGPSDPDGDALTYAWDVNGDGDFTDAAGVNPSLTWAQLQSLGIDEGPGSFDVQVRVDDGHGHVVTSDPTELTVANVAPTANAGEEQFVLEMDPVSLTGTFTDPGTSDTHTFLWQVESTNGQLIDEGGGTTFNFVPEDDGVYFVTFTVTDDDGDGSSHTAVVSVGSVAPVAAIFGAADQASPGMQVDLTTLVTDVSPADEAAGFFYQWYVTRDADIFNGGELVAEGTAADLSFTPDLAGAYYVTLFVNDKDGGSTLVETQFTVTDPMGVAPTVTLDAPVASLDEGGSFTAAGSLADADVDDSWTATVDYGDGSGEQPLMLNPDNSFALGHVYADDGEYAVTVTVTDAAGQSGTASLTVTVGNVAPAVSPLPAVTALQGAAFAAAAGSFNDPGADEWTASVDWGDGSAPQPLELGPDGSFTLSHAFAAAGQFTVTVSVGDDDGGLGTATFVATVQPSPTVTAVAVNGGGEQRSKVNSLEVTFDKAVTLDADAFVLTRRDGAAPGTVIAVANPSLDGRTYVLTFNGTRVLGGSLADGIYDLRVRAGKVHAGDIDMTFDVVFAFHRLFSDADGDGDSDNGDAVQMGRTYNLKAGDAGFLWYWDYNGDGDVDNGDVVQVRPRRGIVFVGY
jgi:CSLREA domain-containing protein